MDLDLVIRRFDQVRNERANWETLWQQIADRVLPQAADFTTQRADGERRTDYMYDATAALAAQKAVAAISTFIWPPNQRYQRLTTSNSDLNKVQAVKVYLDEVTDRLFKARYSPRAAFEAQMGESALQNFVFGTGVLFVDDDIKNRALRYKSLHLARTYILENAAGVVDTVYRCYPQTLRQLNQRFPGKLPEKWRQRLVQNPDEVVECAHVVLPRDEYEPGAPGARNMPWASLYFLPADKLMLEEGGFHTWPFGIMRYSTSPGEVYGRSPAWMALSDIKVLNAMKKTVLAAAQKVVDPPLLLPEDGVLQPFSMAPGSLNYGGVNEEGRQLVHPLVSNARVDIGMDMMDKEREIIGSAFLLDVFRVLVEHPDMTATQTLELLQERATLISPIGGRIESEALGPMTEREIALLTHAWQLPPMPPEMIEAAGEYRIEYTSPMRQAMRASDGIAITRTLSAVLPLAQTDPSVLDPFDLPAAARELAEINGMPSKLLKSAEDMKNQQAQRQQQMDAQALVAAAQPVSAAAANLAKVQAAGGIPQI